MSQAQDMVTNLSGWKALNLDNQAYKDLNEEQHAQILAINSDMRELFMDSELGKRVLGVLIDWTIRQPTARPELGPEMAYFREGQNDIVRSILSACHNSEEGKK
jgi:hypothetical protein